MVFGPFKISINAVDQGFEAATASLFGYTFQMIL